MAEGKMEQNNTIQTVSFEGNILTFYLKLALDSNCSMYEDLKLENQYKDCVNMTKYVSQIKVTELNETHEGDFKFNKK